MDSFNVFEVDASESICEVNLPSMQKGEENLRLPIEKRLELAEILAPALTYLAPGRALVVYRGDYDT